MRSRLMARLHAALETRFPERRLFLRSDVETRFIRLKSETQVLIWIAGTLLISWTIIATAIILMDSIGAGNFRAQASRDQLEYEDRLTALANERDRRAEEAAAAQGRFSSALAQISVMQSELLASEDQRRELETGIEVIQSTLRRAVHDRRALEGQIAEMTAGADGAASPLGMPTDTKDTVELLSSALAQTTAERNMIEANAEGALSRAADLELEVRLMEEKNDEIFRQIEDALLISVEPLDKMFRDAGLDPEQLLDEVRRGYSGLGGPEMQSLLQGDAETPEPDALRALGILENLDRINLYRIAAERVPLAMPVLDRVRFTSGFGPRWNRAHEGIDLAGPIGTPIFATADGTVTFAGWSSGYGRLIKIRHSNGIETRYGHLNAIRVEVGQRVSRGDRIGDMGNSGRSTGPHLHYEVRVGGEAVNPMIYIRAGQDVF